MCCWVMFILDDVCQMSLAMIGSWTMNHPYPKNHQFCKTAQLRTMNVPESNNITISELYTKVEKPEEYSTVNKPSAQIISKELPTTENFSLMECCFVKHDTVVFKKEEDDIFDELTERESPTEENFSLMEYSFVKHETEVFNTEEGDTFHELAESKLSGREIIDEHSDDLKYITPEEIYVKKEIQEEDQCNINEVNEREIKDEYFDGLKSIAHEDIVIKTEDQQDDQPNSKYFDPEYEESHKAFTCRYCYTGLSTEKYKNSHERMCKLRNKEHHLSESVFECSYCKLLYMREADKNNHQTVCKKRKESAKCEESSRKKGVRKYCCDKCSYETIHKSGLIVHIPIHDKVNAPRYSCNQCAYQTIYESNLKKHLRIHNCFGLICILCQKSFKHKVNLDAHYVSRHRDKPEKWGSMITNKINECPKCLYKTVHTGDFKNHLAKHGSPTGQVQFKCNICGHTCTKKSHLTRHLRLHAGQLPYVCIECDHRFNTKQQLDGHIITRHSENEELISSVTSKVRQCDKCSYKTVNSSGFKTHLKTCL